MSIEASPGKRRPVPTISSLTNTALGDYVFRPTAIRPVI
jgi:hypothetical protein